MCNREKFLKQRTFRYYCKLRMFFCEHMHRNLQVVDLQEY